MDGHVHAAFLSHGYNSLQKIAEVFPQILFVQPAVSLEQGPQILLLVAGVPAGEGKLAGQGIHLFQLILIVYQGGGAIGQRLVQLGPGPVEHRHEVVADAFNARFSQPADVLLIIGDQTVAGGAAQLDVLVDGHAFHHVENQSVGFHLRFQGGDAFPAPDLADRHVVDGGDDAAHIGDLTDVTQGDGVVLAIPAKRQFHGRCSSFLNRQSEVPDSVVVTDILHHAAQGGRIAGSQPLFGPAA